ncbi:hypothetical protein SAMN00790413_06306 [Deinococcus hopiensis KR-140]|uniref:Uncharacterized protein n=1 Tax=Deinococcus hopiensis KR-140 TaxID=695939 RepID=A0A1W1VUI3_9DEIO|nr:hypothetical protein SAMN00790413_06306 [Deinococcus hopiensis KR-140]
MEETFGREENSWGAHPLPLRSVAPQSMVGCSNSSAIQIRGGVDLAHDAYLHCNKESHANTSRFPRGLPCWELGAAPKILKPVLGEEKK